MPRAVSPFAYPNQYWDIVKGCALGGRFSHEVENPKVGHSMQQKFYAFRTALRREHAKARLGGSKMSPEQQEKVAEHLLFAEKTICWVDRAHIPSKVTYCNIDQHPDAIFLDKVLAAAEVLPVTPGVEEQLKETAARLLKQGQEKETEEDPTGGKYG